MQVQAPTLIEKLAPESDARALRSVAIAFVLALGFSWYLSQMEMVIEKIFFNDVISHDSVVKVDITKKPVEPKAQPKPKDAKQMPTKADPNQQRSGSAQQVKGKPRVKQAIGVLALIEARTKSMNQDAYTLMNRQMHNDVQKTLESNAKLVTQGQQQLGERRGKATGRFDGGAFEGGAGDIGTAINSLLQPVALHSTRAVGSLVPIKSSEIDFAQGHAGRSAQEIMQVVKSKTPSLRHIYTRSLKQNVGMSGKVTLRFTILPSGDVVDCQIVSSTTGNEGFDESVRLAVLKWKFKTIPSGNTTVSMPFAFTE